MAEFCLDCFNKYWKKNLTINDVNLSEDFCEGCDEYKPCVVTVRQYPLKPKKVKFPFFKK